MSKSDSMLRGQISKLEGSLKSARDKNSKDSSKKKDLEVNYADMTLILAGVSNKMDSERFEVKYKEQNPKSTNEDSDTPDKNQNALTNEEFCDIEPYEDFDEDDEVPYPSMGRYGALLQTLNETESQIDLRDFNDLEAPVDTTNIPTAYQQHTESGYTRDISSDRAEDETDTPQQEDSTVSYPLGQEYNKEYSEEYDTPITNGDYEKPTTLIRNRTRSKTIAEDPYKGPNRANKSSRSYSQTDPNTQVEEPYYFENEQTYAKPSLVVDNYRSSQIYNDDQLEDYDPNALSPVSIKQIGSIGSNHSDSDSEYDSFIHQRQEQNPQSLEDMRAKSPYYQQPVSKSSLASYPKIEKSVSPQEVMMRQKSRNQEQHKRLTMPQSVVNYEESAANSRRSPNPYSKYKTSTANPPDGKLLFRSFQSARDSTPYDTVLSARKVSIPNYGPNMTQYEPEIQVYDQVEERHLPYKQPSQNQRAKFNRNKSTNHRSFVSHSRQDIVSPTSPPMEIEYDDDIPYETTVNTAEIMNMYPQPEYASPYHYANMHHTAPRPNPNPNHNHRQQAVARNIYAAPHNNAVTPVNRNHVYVHNNDTSPVQSLDSGIASLYNDVSYRPRTVAGQVAYYNNDFDYGETGETIDDEPNMEELVLQLKNELKLLSSKIQRFEDQSVVPAPAPVRQVMSPIGQKYPVYSPSQLRSISVASSGSDGGRAKQGPQSPQMTSPNMRRSPLPHHQYMQLPRHSQHSEEYAMQYAQPKVGLPPPSPINRDRALGLPQSNHLKKQLLPQTSSPAINRPNSVSKFTSNTSQDRIHSIPHPAPLSTRPVLNRTQGSNVPRAKSSAGTATYSALPTSRLNTTPRYTPRPLINRTTSPLPPKTTARKPAPTRVSHSSRSNRGPDAYHYDEEIIKKPSGIPNPNQRYH